MSSDEPGPQEQSLLSAFKHRAFTAMWGAMVVSSTGVWINEIAVGWVMTGLTSSPIYISLIQACTVAPIFLFGLAAGALGDRMDRRKYLLTVECALMCVALLLAAVVFSGQATPVILLLLTFMTGTALAFSSPVRQAVLANLVPKSFLGSAFTLNAIGFNGARAVGPALGGFLIAAFGVVTAILTTALSFLSVVFVLLRWRGDPSQKETTKSVGGRDLLADTAAGWSYLWHEATIRNAMLRHFCFMFGASAFWALLPLEARALSGDSALMYSVAIAIVGVGSMVGGWPVPRLLAKHGPELVLGLGLLLVISSLISLSIGGNRIAGFAALACFGVGWIVVSAVIGTTVQIHAADQFRARVMSVFMVEYALSLMAGSVTWGLVSAMTDSSTTFVAAALTVLFGWGLALLAPLRRATA